MTHRKYSAGAEIVADGTRFELYSRHARSVHVCLFNSPNEAESDRKTLTSDGSGHWTCTAMGIGAGQLYGFRVDGPFDPGNGHRFNQAKLLVDPCALAITGEPPLDDSFSGSRPDNDWEPDTRDTGTICPKSIVVDRRFDWQGDTPPRTPWEETVVYECHVRGASIRHPDVPTSIRGTYLGLASEPILDHLSSLGVTAIELLPVQQIASESHLLERGLHNSFGYSPLGLCAPHAGYATVSDGGQVREFKRMVQEFHRRGIEVIVDIVLNHTAEGNHRGRTLSLRGIDNRTYYRLRPDEPHRYLDTTGCGNTVAAGDPAVADLLRRCLRYWVEEMHVDGFRFDLAVSIGRTDDGFAADAPIFRAIAADPVLSAVKLIAEPWDMGPKGYQRGSFPPGWVEWDDRFRDAARKIWRGHNSEPQLLSEIIAGRTPALPGEGHPKAPSVHFVTCHDGFTLEDLVSYEHKHNWANGEENRDGAKHNLSCNWGVEGPTESPRIAQLRQRAKRNLLATTLLSPGIPMLLYGDELGRTQHGNNNAYCQDSDLSWVDSESDGQDDLPTFVSTLIRLRARLRPLRTRSSTDPQWWIASNGRRLELGTEENRPDAVGRYSAGEHGVFLTLLNGETRDRMVRLPRQSESGRWIRLVSTIEAGSRRLEKATYRLCARSISVLEFVPEASPEARPNASLETADDSGPEAGPESGAEG